jgi:hypothetical protein
MTRRRIGLLLTLALGLLAVPLATAAPPPKKVPTLGVFLSRSPPTAPDWKQRSVLLQELRSLGWIEGENLHVEYRWASGRWDRGANLAADLVGLHVDIIVVGKNTHRNAAYLGPGTGPRGPARAGAARRSLPTV